MNMVQLGRAALLCAALTGLASLAWAQKAPAAKAPAKPASAAAPAASSTTTGTATAIGTVDLLSGTVTITTLQGTPRNITAGMALEVGDTIKTEDESEAHATMLDGAFLAVRANSSIKITGYAANGNSKDTSLLNLLKGSLRTVTGWIGKTRPGAYRVLTPTATIGVRGTDHEVIYLSEEDAQTPAEAGTHSVVFEGGTTLETPQGQVDVAVGQAAFVAPKTFIPQLHARELPVFLVRARGQYDNDIVQHRNGLDSIMQRGLIERGMMREGQSLQDIFRGFGAGTTIPGANSKNLTPQQQNQQRQMQGAQNEIMKNVFGGPGNVNEPLPVPFNIPGAGSGSGAPSMGVPSMPSGGSGGYGGGSLPSVPRR
jgi:FecR protein